MKKLQTQFVRDISRYTENFCLGMSPRQTVCAFLGAGVVAAAAFWLHLPVYAAVALGFPVVLLGFWKPDGLPVEKYLSCWIESTLKRPPSRVFQSDDTLYAFLWKGRIGGRQVFDPREFETEDILNEDMEIARATRKEEEEPELSGGDMQEDSELPASPGPRRILPDSEPQEQSVPAAMPEKKPKSSGGKKTARKSKPPLRLADLPQLVNDGGETPSASLVIPETPVRRREPRQPAPEPWPFALPEDDE